MKVSKFSTQLHLLFQMTTWPTCENIYLQHSHWGVAPLLPPKFSKVNAIVVFFSTSMSDPTYENIQYNYCATLKTPLTCTYLHVVKIYSPNSSCYRIHYWKWLYRQRVRMYPHKSIFCRSCDEIYMIFVYIYRSSHKSILQSLATAFTIWNDYNIDWWEYLLTSRCNKRSYSDIYVIYIYMYIYRPTDENIFSHVDVSQVDLDTIVCVDRPTDDKDLIYIYIYITYMSL